MCIDASNQFLVFVLVFFFFQAEDGIRDTSVTGVQTCALPICRSRGTPRSALLAPYTRSILSTTPENRRFCPPAAVRLRRVLANDEDETGRPKPSPSGSAHTCSLDGS